MMEKIFNFTILLALFVSGCATTKTTDSFQLPPSLSQSKEITFKDSNSSYSKEDCVKAVISSLGRKCDKFEEKYIKSLVDEGFERENYTEKIFNPIVSYGSMIERADKYFEYVFNRLFFDYELKYNTATGKNLHPQIYTKFTKSENELKDSEDLSTITHYYSTVNSMSWRWGETEGGRAEGTGIVNYAIKYEIDDLDIKATVKIADIKIDDPILILFRHKVAEISLNQMQTENAFNSIVQEHDFDSGTILYRNFVEGLKSKTMIAILNRYKKENFQSINSSESVNNINFDLAIARLQRKLNSYRYDKDHSRFNFSETIQLSSGASAKIELAIKMFPESGNKTATVYQLEYTPVYDTLSNSYAYGPNNAEKYLNDKIKIVSSLLGKP